MKKNPLIVASAMIFALAAVRFILGFIGVPVAVAGPLNFLIGALFLGIPLLAITVAAQFPWRSKHAGLAVATGFLVQFGFLAVAMVGFRSEGAVAGFLIAVSQIGLPIWCAGLGALVATLIREKNILIPVAIFLVMFDIFLVLTPAGLTGKMVKSAPQVLGAIGAQIPAVSSGPATGVVQKAALAGPADFVFLAMFMIAIYRFGMRGKETARLVIPVLITYMIVVQLLSLPLPALVPIGICVMAVNWKEFKLSKDEKASTAVLAVLGVAILAWLFTQKGHEREARPEPSTAAGDRGAEAPPVTLLPKL